MIDELCKNETAYYNQQAGLAQYKPPEATAARRPKHVAIQDAFALLANSINHLGELAAEIRSENVPGPGPTEKISMSLADTLAQTEEALITYADRIEKHIAYIREAIF